MITIPRSQIASSSSWAWPLHLESYDRSPTLSTSEHKILECLATQPGAILRWETARILSRLLQPCEDVLAHMRQVDAFSHPGRSIRLRRLLCLEMYRRGTTFWVWTTQQWMETLGPELAAFAQRYGRGAYEIRPLIPAFAYLVNPDIAVIELITAAQLQLVQVAQKVFGREAGATAAQQITTVLQGWGYHQEEHTSLLTSVSYLQLLNKNPFLEALTMDVIERAAHSCSLPSVQSTLFQVSRALAALQVIEHPLPKQTYRLFSGSDGSVAPEWLSWCERWRQQTTRPKESRNGVYYQLLKTGRWLHVQHPEITSPAQWTYELAVEFVAAVCHMKVGEWADTQQRHHAPERYGQPLRPRAIHHFIGAMRAFLRDCQEWEWIPVHLNPARALRTPSSVCRLIGPDPRVIEKPLWAKLLWAAMNLQDDDLPLARTTRYVYPLAMVQAVALVWCFAALRSDEICRLRMGCIRWQYEDVMIPETGVILPKDAVCFLEIPVNKTNTAYTKAVHPLVGKAINEWERVRPKDQPPLLDPKTGESVHFLFAYRGNRLFHTFLNACLIPLLCRKAGMPESDSRGTITSHRARATIASQLYNAREPLDILQLKEYLGHKNLSSTQSYVKVDPTKLASKVAQAGYFEQNMATVEVLLDQQAVLSGAAARGEVWKYYDLGHGYCTHTFWAECKHRMACARCPFYRPKTTSMEQLVEGKANLIRMLEYVKLTEEERLLVTEGIELHQSLLEKLANVPTPVGLTPQELALQPPAETRPIQLQTRRPGKKGLQQAESL